MEMGGLVRPARSAVLAIGAFGFCQPQCGGAVVLLLKFDTDELAAKLMRGQQCGAGTGERVKHDAVRGAKSFYQRL